MTQTKGRGRGGKTVAMCSVGGNQRQVRKNVYSPASWENFPSSRGNFPSFFYAFLNISLHITKFPGKELPVLSFLFVCLFAFCLLSFLLLFLFFRPVNMPKTFTAHEHFYNASVEFEVLEIWIWALKLFIFCSLMNRTYFFLQHYLPK